jgi:hypothetical protein
LIGPAEVLGKFETVATYLRNRDNGNLGAWDTVSMGLCEHGTLGPLDFGTMGLRDFGTLGIWNHVIYSLWSSDLSKKVCIELPALAVLLSLSITAK